MSGTIDQLIISGPYDEPLSHWRYERESRTFTQVEGRRPAGYVVAALHEWVHAVTEHGGFGRWTWGVSKSPSDLQDVVRAAA